MKIRKSSRGFQYERTFNLYNHRGYITVQVVKGGKYDIRANAYGHYTHETIGFTTSIDIKTGSIGLDWAAKESKNEQYYDII